MKACQAAAAKPRKVFNAAKQRIGAIEGVTQADVRAAAEAEKRKAAAKKAQKEHEEQMQQAQMMQQQQYAQQGGGQYSSRGGRGDPDRNERPAGSSNCSRVMLGKDGRPLSPLSAAIARKKAGLDPYDEGEDVPADVRPCPNCGRNFAADRLHVHLSICQKVSTNAQQRGTFNATNQRLKDSAVSGGFSPPMGRASQSSRRLDAANGRFRASHTPGDGGGTSRDDRRASATSRSADVRGGFGGMGGGGGGLDDNFGRPPSNASNPFASTGDIPANKKAAKWQRDRANLQAALRSGRQLKAAQDAGVPAHLLPPPPPTDDANDDRTPCPHCGRKFNIAAAERHIPKCASIQAKPKTLTRGARPGGLASGPTGGKRPGYTVL